MAKSINPKIRFFDDAANHWSNCDNKELEEILSLHKSYIGNNILDIGSGTGVTATALNKLLPGLTRVCEIDFSSEMLTKAKTSWNPNEHVSFIRADAHFLPLMDKSFDTIICFCSFPHLEDKEKALKEFFRVLNTKASSDGIIFIIHLMNHDSLNRMHSEKALVVQKDHLPSVENLSRFFIKNNFHILHAEESSRLYLLIAGKNKI